MCDVKILDFKSMKDDKKLTQLNLYRFSTWVSATN